MSSSTVSTENNTSIKFELNGKTITANQDETILKAAQRHGVEIPHLCYKDGLEEVGEQVSAPGAPVHAGVALPDGEGVGPGDAHGVVPRRAARALFTRRPRAGFP